MSSQRPNLRDKGRLLVGVLCYCCVRNPGRVSVTSGSRRGSYGPSSAGSGRCFYFPYSPYQDAALALLASVLVTESKSVRATYFAAASWAWCRQWDKYEQNAKQPTPNVILGCHCTSNRATVIVNDIIIGSSSTHFECSNIFAII